MIKCKSGKLKYPALDGKRGKIVKRYCKLKKKNKVGRSIDYRHRSHEHHEKKYRKARRLGWR